MKKSFTLNYNNLSFMLRKDDVHFANGYGIVRAQLDVETWLIGVVDEKFKEVLPLTSAEYAPKLFIALNGNFIFVAFNSELEEYQVLHLDREGNTINLEANYFLELNDEVIQLYYDEYSALYDTQSGEFLTPFYNYIGPFVYSEKHDCKVARATFYIEDENNNIVNEVSTVINIRGEVLEDYFDLGNNTIIATKDSTEVISLVRKIQTKE